MAFLITKEQANALAERILDEPSFRDEFLAMEPARIIIDDVLRADFRELSDFNREDASERLYSIVKWNLGLDTKNKKRRILLDAYFWTYVDKVFRLYYDKDNWLPANTGKGFIDRIVVAKVIPIEVERRIKRYCKTQLYELKLSANIDLYLKEMYQEISSKLYISAATIREPGTLWAFIKSMVENMYSNKVDKFHFTESFEGNGPTTYACLSVYTWSPGTILDVLVTNGVYSEKVSPMLRSLVKEYYHPEKEDSPKTDDANLNEKIKKGILNLFEEIAKNRSFPVYEISLSYNSVYKESFLHTFGKTKKLEEMVPTDGPEPIINDEEVTKEEMIDKLVNDSLREDDDIARLLPDAPRPDTITISDEEALRMMTKVFKGVRPILVEVFFRYVLNDTQAMKETNFVEKYARELEKRQVFQSSEPRDSNAWMENLKKSLRNKGSDARAAFIEGVKKARLPISETRSLLTYFRTHDFE